MCAAMSDQVNTVKLLMERGAVVTAHDVYGQTSLHFAALNVRRGWWWALQHTHMHAHTYTHTHAYTHTHTHTHVHNYSTNCTL